MKFLISIVVTFWVVVSHSVTPVSITQFENKVSGISCDYHWDWWRPNLGDAFKEMLTGELLKSKKVSLFERETIVDVYENEHELINSSNDKSLRKGDFKKAKYTIVGAVSEYEFCADKKGGSIDVGKVANLFGAKLPSINLGLKNAKAKIVVDVRLIDTRTGQVVRAVKGEGYKERSDFDFDTEVADFESAESSPMGEASREAIAKAARKILSAI